MRCSTELHSEAAEQRDAAKNRVLDLERQLPSAKKTLQDREDELAAAAVRDDQLGGRLISAAEALSSELLFLSLIFDCFSCWFLQCIIFVFDLSSSWS